MRRKTMLGTVTEISINGGTVVLDAKGVVKFRTEVDKLELTHSKSFMKCLADNALDENLLILFDAKSLKESTDGTVKKYVSERLEKYAQALAVLNNSAISRFLIHTFLAIYRPKIPVRMFETEEQARLWLLEFKE